MMSVNYKDLGLRKAEIACIEYRRTHGWRRVLEEEARNRAAAFDAYQRSRKMMRAASVLAFMSAAALLVGSMVALASSLH